MQRIPNLDPNIKYKTVIVINTPKSDNSIRDVFINDMIIDKLNAHIYELNQAFVDTVRREGVNNENRLLLIC